MIAVEIALLIAAVLAVGAYIPSGFRYGWILYTVLGFFLAALIFSFFSAWEPTVLLRPITLVLLVPITAFHYIVKSDVPPDERYFDLSFGGIFIIAPFCGIHIVLYGLNPDDVWLVLIVITALCTWLCKRAPRSRFRLRFTTIGTVLFLIWLAALLLHPWMATGTVSSAYLSRSLRLNAVFFVFLVFFFLGGYTRLGLIEKDFSHTKVFFAAATLMLFSWSARFPELEAIIKVLPFGDKLPNVASASLVAFGPLTGGVLAMKNFRKETPNKTDAGDGK